MAMAALGVAPPLGAQITQQEALAAAFPPPATVERKTAYLSKGALDSARAEAGPDAPVSQSVVSYYVGSQDGRPVGVAYFDSHRVRTVNEVLMIVVGPGNRIRNIEVLRFAEPPEYKPADRWLAQFQGKTLTPRLSLRGDIAMMTGATLTSNAVARAVRRVLALHHQIRPFAAP
ncbi:MAG TPA: FMN-binding protein [Gemmatimonadales bacterium]|jgi:Na+-translocating ferredoxin:NAD+ oxidoreductase RnfG subunit